MNNKKFVVTKDEVIANKMIERKFKLVSAIAGVYTFINESSDRFNFDAFDVKKVCFTNNLHL